MSQSGDGSLSRLVPDAIRRRFVYKYVAVVILAMALTAGVGVYFGANATATLDGQVEQQVTATAQLQANELNSWIDGLGHQTRTISEAAPFQRGQRDEVERYLLNRLQNARPDIVAIHYVKISNATVLASTDPGVEGGEMKSRDIPWAKNAATVDNGTDTVSSVYVADTPYNATDGTPVVAFISAPPRNTEHVVVVEAALSTWGGFQQTTDGAFTTVHDADGPLVYGQDHSGASVPDGALSSNQAGFARESDTAVGYASVDNTDWTVVTHVPKQQAYGLRNQLTQTIGALVLLPLVVLGGAMLVVGRRTGSALGDLTATAEQMREGDLDVACDTERVDEIGRLTEAFDAMRVALREQIDEAEHARKEAEVSRAEAIAVNDYLQERADEYSDVMEQCAAGDLTVRLEPDGENDAMDRIAADFSEMVDELEKTTGQLTRFADEVAETGKTIESSAYSLQDASEQIAESIQRVSIDANDQQDRLETISTEMDAVAETLERYAEDHPEIDVTEPLSRTRDVASMVSEVAAVSNETTAEAETVAGAAEEQAAELNEVTEQAEKLSQYASPLGEVLDRFKTEADQEFFFPSGPGNRAEQETND